MPLIRALPAMPSPIPAPMAPPPRASPPPMRPPAVATACVMSFAAILRLSPSRTSCVTSGSVLFGGCKSEVEDGQERVDERLDRGDQAGVEQSPEEVGEPVEREQVERQQCDDGEHDAAGEDVAEESQRERQRVDDLLEDDDGPTDRRLHGEPVTDVARALLLHTEVGVEDDDHGGHRVDEVDVGCRWFEAC